MKPHRLLIVGAGALGRQILGWAMEVPETARDWDVGGFLDDRPGILDGYNRPYGILGDPMSFPLSERDRVVCAIADPRTRLEYTEKLAQRGARFTNVIHPSAVTGFNCTLGEGCVLAPMATLDCDVTLGNHVIMYILSGVGHDTVIGDGCMISSQAVVCGGCTLGRGAFIGTHATVNENTVIGDHAFLASGSVAGGRVPSNAVMMGIPARPIRQWVRLLRGLNSKQCTTNVSPNA